MAGPVDYAKEGAALNKKALIPMFVAVIIMAVITAVPTAIITAVLVPMLGMVGVLVGIIVAAAMQLVASVLQIAYIKMAIRLRKGEQVAAGDVMKFQDFMVNGAILGAPKAAAVLVGLVALVSPGLASLGNLVATVVGIALVWAPFEMALKGSGYMDSWKASLAFWKTNIVGHLIFLIVGGIVAALLGFLIFAGGAVTCAFLMYYTDKTGMQAFTPGAAAPATAGAAK
jgi:hypothetical protein